MAGDTETPETRCAACGATVPSLPYCIRCGAHLEPGAPARAFAAAPDERRVTPRVVSTLFPQLPRDSMAAFRIALLVAVTLIASLAVAGAHPVAIVVAAVAVPALTVVYLYDVDVYEDEPFLVIALIVIGGALMGLVLSVVGRALAPSSADLLSQSTRETVVQQGVVLPIIGLLLALAGPLILLPYPRFNDVLDGTTFGAVSAVWLSATQTLAQSTSLFDEGVRPETETLTWLLRVLQLAIAVPLLWAGVAGAVTGAFWLRYRTLDGQKPRGIIGRPLPALALAGAFVVAAAVAQVVLVLWVAVLVSLALAFIALLWLRQLIHAGLVAEAAEIAEGEPIECANCKQHTPRHSFCGRCGIAMRALPKDREAGGDAFRAGTKGTRLRDRLVLGVFGASLLVAGGAASGVALALAPEAARECFPGEPCGGPPSSAPRLVKGALWRSREGVTLEYDPGRWRADREGDDAIVLVRRDERALVELRIERDVAPRERVVPRELPRRVRLGERLDLPIPHGANVGYLDGTGAWYEGLLDSPQGPKESVTVASLASAYRRTTVAAVAVFFGPAAQTLTSGSPPLRQDIDTILNTVAWPRRGGPVAAGGTDEPEDTSPAAAVRGLRPVDVGRAYEIEPLWRSGIRGRGETIALVSLDTFRSEDVAAYDRVVGIEDAPPVERIPVLGPVSLGGGAVEVHLDIDVIRAVAPEAKILNYEAPLSWEGFVAALKRINDDGRASIVSVSWGKCLLAVDRAVRNAMERELARAARAGTTVFVASGDAGAFSCLHGESELDPAHHQETVDWPAASANVVAVGGTRLSVREDGSYYSEDAWEDTLASDGSGGGISPLDARPTWQQGEGIDGGNRQRLVPDVAAPGDCDSAYFIVYPEFGPNGWTRREGPHGCGTSAAAPFWAAATALVRQYARENGVPSLGFLAPTLYEVARAKGTPAAFNDVQSGGNLKHNATRGWDFATGLGSPKISNLARAVVRHLQDESGSP